MAPPIGSVDGPRGARRLRRKRTAESAEASSASGFTEAAEGAAAASPIPPGGLDPEHAAPAVSAQLMGQSDSAEGAASAKSAARRATSAYLKVEWSGRHDRRTRRGRIAKTDV
jgi:hypothetical protein